MKSKINKKIKDTFDAVELINDVKVSPFFKEHVMHKIRNASEDIKDTTWSWFSPQLQLATLVCVVALNVFAFTKLNETTYNENLSEFAQSYGLLERAETSLFK